MDRIEKVISRFNEGFNCAQAIISVYGPELGLDNFLALRVSNGFGAGIGRLGEICGAVNGAIMVLGLKYGGTRVEDSHSKEKLYSYIRKFVELFKNNNNSIQCKILLDTDISTAEGMEKARSEGLFSNLCPKFIKDAAMILEKLI